MTDALLTVNENSQVVRQGLQNLGAKIPQVGRLGIYRTAQRIKSKLGKPGFAISYPVRWDSDKQRRAFFATNGFGRGIPTVRRGETEGGWELTRLETGYKISNNTAGALFVYGDMFGKSQSMIHNQRWPLFRDVIEQEIINAPNDISDELRMAIVAEGFAPGL